MLSEQLSGFCTVTNVVFEADDYLIARVEIDGKAYFAEISPSDSASAGGRWPGVPGVLLPVNQRGFPDGQVLLLFPDSGEEFVLERIKSVGFRIEAAVTFCTRLMEILKELHSSARYAGYLGPENLLISGSGRPILIGGKRGVPDSPFSAPEVIGRASSEPRNDVYALGSLLFRMIAGTDDREKQIGFWNELPDRLRLLIGEMVSSDPRDRQANIEVLHAELSSFQSEPPARASGPDPDRSGDDQYTFSGGKPWKRKHNWLLYSVISLIVAVLAVILLFNPFGGNRSARTPDESQRAGAPDTLSTEWLSESSDSLETPDTTVVPFQISMDSAIVWVTNCTGRSGAAMDYRAEQASGFSYVYTTSGTSRRTTSVLLVRRADASVSLEQQPAWPLVSVLLEGDSTITPMPTDISILLGTDLLYDGVNSQHLMTPDTPAGTLYVDIANNGLQYTLGGLGAATWTSSVLDGKSLDLDGSEWLLRVVDSRDGDVLNEELGIPETLQSTQFLYHPDNDICSRAEEKIRSALQALPAEPEKSVGDVKVPDIWVLLGT